MQYQRTMMTSRMIGISRKSTSSLLTILLFTSLSTSGSTAWTNSPIVTHLLPIKESTAQLLLSNDVNDDAKTTTLTRREALHKSMPLASVVSTSMISYAAGTKRCDPGDERCRQNGKLDDSLPKGQPIPKVTNRITYVVQMIIDVGERMEYESLLEDRLEIDYAPVSLNESGGIVQNICPDKGIDFGVPSQSKAYAKNRGMRAVGPDFVPQSRPVPTLEDEAFPRMHTVAGLISVPVKGIGYGGNPKADLDEAFASAFTITASSDTSSVLDKANSPQRQRVIGQVIDNESMEFLDRLSKLPIQKKIGRSLEGGGPPLLKVRVRDVDVQKVKQ